jgi:alpha-methylacyl-CoA racemase
MTDRVHAPVDAVEPALLDPMSDSALPQPQLDELLEGNDAVLPGSPVSDSGIDRSRPTFRTYFVRFVGFGFHPSNGGESGSANHHPSLPNGAPRTNYSLTSIGSGEMGPLHGVKVVEIASIGPGPFAAMMLADMGADVVRLERAGAEAGLGSGSWNYMHRGRPSVACDLKSPAGRDLALRLCTSADALIEGFRPGVMERLGLGPEPVAERNPQLVYGRMTGYGQEGPMSAVAGHDVNYVALSGALAAIAREGERPLFPLNLVGDFGGGGMVLALGVLAAVIEARESGRGQVVNASMVEGASVLMTLMHAMREIGMWSDRPGTNLLDSGAHFYEVYECSDGGHIAVGALEPQFYAALLALMELDPDEFPQMDRSRWPELKGRFAAVFRTKTRDEWAAILEPAEACATPVLGMGEAPDHPHNAARNSFIEVGGKLQPAPAPRFSRTPSAVPEPPPEPGADTESALAAWGLSPTEIDQLRAGGGFG